MVTYQNRNESVSVGTTAFQLTPLLKDGERIVISIKNTSLGGQKVSISIGLGQTAVAGTGITLNPSESWTESMDSGFNPAYEPFSIVADGAGATISFYERVRV